LQEKEMPKSEWIGKKLSNRYLIDEILGQGGMSAVYRASDPNLKRVVAIKIIHPHLSSDPDFVQRFEEEAARIRAGRNLSGSSQATE
jgi:serine/threonine-protein kinase